MRTDRKEVEATAFLSDSSRQIKRLQDAGVVAAYHRDTKAWGEISPGSKGKPGRPNDWLTLAPDLGYLIGVDIAHTHVSASITKADFGKVLDVPLRKPMSELDEDPQAAFDAAALLIAEVFLEAHRRHGARAEEVIGIGIGLPAPVNRETKTVAPEMNILSAWTSSYPAEELSDRLHKILPETPIEVDNDASLGALGVHCCETLSSDPDEVPRDLLYVRVGDGIGAGVVIKGKLVGGGSGFAGEIGHVKIDERGHFCPRCGQRGCVETKTSDKAVLAEMQSTVFARVPGPIDIEDVITRRHPACYRVLHEAGWHLGVALAHARTLLDPTRIYIGGPMSESERFMHGIREGIVGNSLTLAERVHDLVVPVPGTLAEVRPDLQSPELLGAVAIALHRCGDAHIERRLAEFQAPEIGQSSSEEDSVSVS
jgi:predicted NBD/HSP70 family sugar kinase